MVEDNINGKLDRSKVTEDDLEKLRLGWKFCFFNWKFIWLLHQKNDDNFIDKFSNTVSGEIWKTQIFNLKSCRMCFDEYDDITDIVLARCCKNSRFHRTCLTSLGINQGLSNFKCPLCAGNRSERNFKI